VRFPEFYCHAEPPKGVMSTARCVRDRGHYGDHVNLDGCVWLNPRDQKGDPYNCTACGRVVWRVKPPPNGPLCGYSSCKRNRARRKIEDDPKRSAA
jgi:hypothetical protein